MISLEPEEVKKRGREDERDQQCCEGTGGAQAVAGYEPVEGEDHPLPAILGRSAFRAASRWPSAPHLHLAVVEVGGAGLVLAIFKRLAQQPIQGGDPGRVEDFGLCFLLKPRGRLTFRGMPTARVVGAVRVARQPGLGVGARSSVLKGGASVPVVLLGQSAAARVPPTRRRFGEVAIGLDA